jgi:hypothetical protein
LATSIFTTSATTIYLTLLYNDVSVIDNLLYGAVYTLGHIIGADANTSSNAFINSDTNDDVLKLYKRDEDVSEGGKMNGSSNTSATSMNKQENSSSSLACSSNSRTIGNSSGDGQQGDNMCSNATEEWDEW